MRVAPLGRMALQVTPYRPSAFAVDQVSPRMPAFAARVVRLARRDPSADTDDMLMTRPYRCSRIVTEAARVQLNIPFRWTAMTASHPASVMLKIIRSRRIPATLTRMSIRPNASTAWSIIAGA